MQHCDPTVLYIAQCSRRQVWSPLSPYSVPTVRLTVLPMLYFSWFPRWRKDSPSCLLLSLPLPPLLVWGKRQSFCWDHILSSVRWCLYLGNWSENSPLGTLISNYKRTVMMWESPSLTLLILCGPMWGQLLSFSSSDTVTLIVKLMTLCDPEDIPPAYLLPRLATAL